MDQDSIAGQSGEGESNEPEVSEEGLPGAASKDPGTEGQGDDLNPLEREERMVPVGALQRERQKYQKQISALEGKMAQLEKVAKAEANKEGGTDSEKERARLAFRKALGIDEMHDMLTQMKEGFDQLSAQVSDMQRYNGREQKRYIASVEGYVMDNFYKGDKIPVDGETYAELYGAKMTDEDQAVVMDPESEPGEIHAVLEQVHKRVVKSLQGIIKATDLSKDYGKVRTLPKVPGPGGGPPPQEERPVLLGKDLHKHAQRVFESVKARG